MSPCVAQEWGSNRSSGTRQDNDPDGRLNALGYGLRSVVLIILDRLIKGFLDLHKLGAAVDFKPEHILHIENVHCAFAKC